MPTSDSTHRSAPNAPRARASSAYGSLSSRAAAALAGEQLDAGSSEGEPRHPAADDVARRGRRAGGARLVEPAELGEGEDLVEQQDRAPRPGEVAVEAVVDVEGLVDEDERLVASSGRRQGEGPSAEDLEAEPRVVGVQQRFACSTSASSTRPAIDRIVARWAARACTAHGAAEEVRGLVEHRERAVRIGQGVEAIGRAPADDADPVGLGQLVEVDAGEDRLEPLGFVASEVELGEQLHRPRPAAGGRGTAHEPLGDGVVAFEEGEACRVQHILPVDRAAGVEPPGDEPHTIVAAAGADRLERLGELATQPPPPERRQLAEEDLGEQRVGERHPDAPSRSSGP